MGYVENGVFGGFTNTKSNLNDQALREMVPSATTILLLRKLPEKDIPGFGGIKKVINIRNAHIQDMLMFLSGRLIKFIL